MQTEYYIVANHRKNNYLERHKTVNVRNPSFAGGAEEEQRSES